MTKDNWVRYFCPKSTSLFCGGRLFESHKDKIPVYWWNGFVKEQRAQTRIPCTVSCAELSACAVWLAGAAHDGRGRAVIDRVKVQGREASHPPHQLCLVLIHRPMTQHRFKFFINHIHEWRGTLSKYFVYSVIFLLVINENIPEVFLTATSIICIIL